MKMKMNVLKTSALACAVVSGLISAPLMANGSPAPLTPAEYAVLENDDRRLTSATITGDSLDMQVTSPRGYNETVSVNIGDAESVSLNTSRSLSNQTNITNNTNEINNVNTRVDNINTDYTIINNKITNNRNSIANNTQEINNVNIRLDNIDVDTTKIVNNNRNDINTNRNDINTNTTAISALDQHYRTTAADHQRQIDQVTSDMRYLDRNLSAGIASAMAIGQHQFDPTYTGGQVSLSGGVFNGQNAVSFAVGVPLGNRAFFSAAIATDSGQYGESGAVGVSLRLPK